MPFIIRRTKLTSTVICIAMMMCNFLAAGPSIAIVTTTMDFFPGASPGFNPAVFATAVGRVSYFFTAAALMQGVGNFFWVPIANKYGRRPTYVFSYLIYTVRHVKFRNLSKEISAHHDRLRLSGSALSVPMTASLLDVLLWALAPVPRRRSVSPKVSDTISTDGLAAPITIADVFFLHERGTVMALYTSFLAVGASLGVIISGLITIHHEWRVIYQVAAPLVAFVLLLAFFSFPETAYIRELPNDKISGSPRLPSADQGNPKTDDAERATEKADTSRPPNVNQASAAPQKKPYLQTLRIFNKTMTDEGLLKLVVRPLGLICLPPVLWAALVQAATIGFLVAISSNIDVAFHTTYGFESWQVGLCFIAAIIGSIFGIPAGGHLADTIADRLTKRNGGVRDPEMRLPTMIPSLITMPLSLVLYGVGIEHGLHWMCPTIGLALCKPRLVRSL